MYFYKVHKNYTLKTLAQSAFGEYLNQELLGLYNLIRLDIFRLKTLTHYNRSNNRTKVDHLEAC